MADDAKLTAFDGAPSDNFGFSVSLSGDGNTALVGSYLDDDKGSSSGSAYLYQATDAGWSVTKLVAHDGAAGDSFGYSVSLSHDGNAALIGSYLDDDKGSNSGSAYIYQSTASGWVTTKLTAPDGAAGDAFGYSVALSDNGGTAVVGARMDDDKGSNSGSAYVYQKTDAGWVATKLVPVDGAAGDLFGNSVAVSGDGHTALIGSYLDDDKGSNSGSAYLYRQTDAGWSATKLVAHDGAAADSFGYSVALSNDGNTALVGSYLDDDKGSSSGSAYIYRWDGSIWNETKLIAPDGASGDNFGFSVSLSDDGSTAVVGARLDDDKGSNSGSAYVFHWNGATWETVKLVAADGASTDYFGHSVAVSGDGDTALIGARLDDDRGLNSGSAYVLTIDKDAAPVSVQDQFTTTEDSPLVSSLVVDTGSDEEDPDVVDTRANVTFALSSDPAKQPSHGNIVVNADGTYTYTPDAAQQALGNGEKITDSFTVLVKDSLGVTTEQAVTITIVGANDAPVVSVVNPAASTEGNAGHSDPVAIDLFHDLTTASDVDRTDHPAYRADSISVMAASGSATNDIGLITVDQATGTVDYDKAAFDFLAAGQQALYTVSFDVQSGSDVVHNAVTLTINGENDAPTVSGSLSAEANEGDSVLALDLLKGASDIDAGAILSVQGLPASLPDGISLGADGHTITIDPNSPIFDRLAVGDQQVLTFNYQVSDGASAAKQTATIAIHGVNDGPEVSEGIAAVGTEGTDRLTVNLLEHASDADAGETATLSISGLDPAALPASFALSDDGKSLLIDTNDPAFDVLGAGESVTTTLTYNVVDVHGASVAQTATVTIVGADDTPVVSVVNPAASTEGNAGHSDPVAIDLFHDLTTASDVDRTDHPAYRADSISVETASGSATNDIGLITLDQATGTVGYDKAAFDFLAAGQQALYTVSFDVQSGSDVVHKTVTLTINGENDAPTVSGSLSAEANEGDSVLALDLLKGASDIDAGAILSVQGLPASLPAGLSLGADGHTLVLDPSHAAFDSLGVGESAKIALNYSVSDEHGASVAQVATLTITGVNDAPTASNDTGHTDEDHALAIDVLGNDTDPDARDVLTIAGAHVSSGLGSVAVASDGKSILYDPTGKYDYLAAGEQATVEIRYDIADAHIGTASALATVMITGVNDGPVAQADTGAVLEDQSVFLDVLGNDSDIDRDPLSIVSLFSGSGEGKSALGASIAIENGTVHYTADADSFDLLAANSSVLDTFSYTISDHHGGTSTATISIAVKGDADATPIYLGNGTDAFTDFGERDSIVYGENGDDRLNGMGGADQLHGGNGSDRLDGGTGSDTLFGDRGDDWLTGGKGADTFVFDKAGGADTVTDFQIGVDHLHLDGGLTLNRLSSADIDHNGVIDTVVQFSNGTVTLLNTGAIANAQDHFFV